jgi:hypothetical protein
VRERGSNSSWAPWREQGFILRSIETREQQPTCLRLHIVHYRRNLINSLTFAKQRLIQAASHATLKIDFDSCVMRANARKRCHCDKARMTDRPSGQFQRKSDPLGRAPHLRACRQSPRGFRDQARSRLPSHAPGNGRFRSENPLRCCVPPHGSPSGPPGGSQCRSRLDSKGTAQPAARIKRPSPAREQESAPSFCRYRVGPADDDELLPVKRLCLAP